MICEVRGAVHNTFFLRGLTLGRGEGIYLREVVLLGLARPAAGTSSKTKTIIITCCLYNFTAAATTIAI